MFCLIHQIKMMKTKLSRGKYGHKTIKLLLQQIQIW